MIFNIKIMLKKIIIIFLLCIWFFSFFKINEKNYEKYNEIKINLIKHPENLPNKTTAKATSFWFENLKADIYWLKTIQYIWANAFHSEYKKYLFSILDLVTELNPYFEKPYIIGQLLLPGYEKNYEFITEDEQKVHLEEAVKLGLKWVENFCNIEKIKLIDDENDLLKIWNNTDYKNPCLSYKVPYYLAYIYYYYKNNLLESAKYYKIASANDDSLEWAKTMAAIMQWKWWDREKSFFMFLNLAKFIEPENEVCNITSKELENIWVSVFIKKETEIDWNLLKNIENFRQKAFNNLQKNELTEESKCPNYINKAIREFNLDYIETANKKYFSEKGKNSKNAKQLFDEWYINYLPVDFQQNTDYGIIYIFNEATWNYDYDMGIY